VLVIGSDIRQEQPLLAHRIRKARSGAAVCLVNPYELALTHPAGSSSRPGRLLRGAGRDRPALGAQGDGAPPS
jgi:NADH-quinone oxidoreductase subunit G